MAKFFLFKNRKRAKKPVLIPALFLFLLVCFFVLRGGINYGQAGEGDNVRGYAWSSTIGWISFNCVNNSTCGTADYGVRIGTTTKNFSGYAWSSSVGWISFQDAGAPDYSFNANCPSVCNNGNNCTACLDPETGKIWGWAHIVSLGSDGWIKLRDAADLWTGVYLDTTHPSSTWRGWAWNGNDDGVGIGWINFNCLDASPVSWCATSSYATWVKGMNFPVVDNLSAPNWGFDDACLATKGFTLRWDIQDRDTGYSQSAYRVRIATSSSPVSYFIDTNRRFSASEQFSTTTARIEYGKPYYWWVMVWDNFGLPSPWFQFYTGTPSSTLTDNIASNTEISGVNAPYTFTTYGYEFPDVNFTWNPYKPLVDENTSFVDVSRVYYMAAPTVPVNCTKTTCSWLWSGDGIKTNSTPTASTTVMTFSFGDHNVNDRVRGPGGYTCTSTQPIFVDLLPKWREVKPSR